MNTETLIHRGIATWLWLVFIFFLPTILSAQAPFTGGQGDGYAKASLTNVQVSLDAEIMNEWKVYPQPVRIGESLTIELPGNQSPTRLSILTMQGQIIQEKKTLDRTESISLEMNRILAGVYILQLISNQESYRQQIVVLNP